MTTILGIDPGSRITGYGVIRVNGSRRVYVTSGCIRMQTSDLATRLQQIFVGLQEIVQTYRPDEAAIEQVFFHQNAGSALKLGQARGAAIVAMSTLSIPVAEYSARQVKQAVVGYGAAKKEQVQHMIKLLLNLQGTPQVDAADALGVALCHANSRELSVLLSRSDMDVLSSGPAAARPRVLAHSRAPAPRHPTTAAQQTVQALGGKFRRGRMR